MGSCVNIDQIHCNTYIFVSLTLFSIEFRAYYIWCQKSNNSKIKIKIETILKITVQFEHTYMVHSWRDRFLNFVKISSAVLEILCTQVFLIF